MKYIIPLLFLTACATKPVPMTVERSAALARASHAVACEGIEAAHANAALTGAKFNAARKACIQADDLLDAADAALVLGQDSTAIAKLKAAGELIDLVKGLKP